MEQRTLSVSATTILPLTQNALLETIQPPWFVDKVAKSQNSSYDALPFSPAN